MKKYIRMSNQACDNLPGWRIKEAAQQMSGLPVGMPTEHLALDAATWLDIFLERDANGVRKPDNEVEMPDRNELIVEYLADHPNSTEIEIRTALIEQYPMLPGSHLGGFIERLEKQGRIERTGQNRARRGKETGIRAPWTWQLTEEVAA